MDSNALQALQESIKHWEEVMANPLEEPIGIYNCPLCIKFYLADCKICPISNKTKKLFCIDTPYEAFSALRKRYKKEMVLYSSLEDPERLRIIYTTKLREAASLEIEFLKSLLPKEE